MCGKTVSITRDAGSLLNNGSAASAQLASHLFSHSELLTSKIEPPIVWFTPSVFNNQRFYETLRFGLLEIQEHLETYLDKKDHASEVNLNLKTDVKKNIEK